MPATGRPLLPGFIIAGTNKAGTSSLWNYLAAHPGVAASAVKETGYWLPLRYPGEALEPLSAYERQWASSDPALLRMEATPGYFYGGRAVAEAIESTCPDVRVLILLREPTARLRSFLAFKQSMLELPVDLPLREYVAQCRALTHDQLLERDHNAFFGVEGGRYVEHLTQWFDVLGDRLRIAFFDDLVHDPRQVVAETCAWLGLDVAAAEHLLLESKNRTVGYRNAGLQRVALRANAVGTEFFGRHPAVKTRLLSVYRRLNGKAVDRDINSDDANVLTELDAWYRTENHGLRELLTSHEVADIPDWVT